MIGPNSVIANCVTVPDSQMYEVLNPSPFCYFLSNNLTSITTTSIPAESTVAASSFSCLCPQAETSLKSSVDTNVGGGPVASSSG